MTKFEILLMKRDDDERWRATIMSNGVRSTIAVGFPSQRLAFEASLVGLSPRGERVMDWQVLEARSGYAIIRVTTDHVDPARESADPRRLVSRSPEDEANAHD